MLDWLLPRSAFETFKEKSSKLFGFIVQSSTSSGEKEAKLLSYYRYNSK
jgi:hypothetical protein